VFYTSLGDDRARAGTRAGLRSARPHLRTMIGRQVRLKYLPQLEFEEDLSIENAGRIEALIRTLHDEEAE
jgi:ribosome-binding factor A